VARTGPGIVVLDLDGDGDERTGWVIFYLHIAEKDRVIKGTMVKAGDAIGHPSCEGGRSTGTHIHIARKFNGEWISADGIIPFNLDGWVAKNGALPYSGFMVKDNWTVRANPNPDSSSFITAK
jgi:murein DD-endopeptidase MepM/ murein hydrolase activator NlpD